MRREFQKPGSRAVLALLAVLACAPACAQPAT